MAGYCKINQNIEEIYRCKECFENWPLKNGIYTRAICKRANWVGKVDASQINESVLIHENYNKECVYEST